MAGWVLPSLFICRAIAFLQAWSSPHQVTEDKGYKCDRIFISLGLGIFLDPIY